MTEAPAPPASPRTKGSRLIAVVIGVLIVLFFVIDFLLRRATEISPASVTNVLLVSLQIIVLLLGLILFFVLGRNLVKLQSERRRKVVGAHFKTKLVAFFAALAFIPALLMFLFTNNLIQRNIEGWFKLDLTRVMEDSRTVADGFYVTASEQTQHFAQQLARDIERSRLLQPGRRADLEAFVRDKLFEYQLDEIGIVVDEEELFAFVNPNLPLQDYQDLKADTIRRAHAGETIAEQKPMGTGEFIRRGVSFAVPGVGSVLVATGKFLPQNYAQKINTIMSYVERYRNRRGLRDLSITLYRNILIFATLIIVFAATWIGIHIAKRITVPIEKLAQATREVSRGNLAVKVEDPASDEIGILIDSFNQMTADLRSGQASIAQKTAEIQGRQRYIEAVLDTVNTGVVALDAEGTITTINPSAQGMLALPPGAAAGRPHREVLGEDRYAELRRAIDQVLRTRHQVSDKEIVLPINGQRTTLALTVTPLRSADREFSGMIVVLDDLTQLISAQRMAAWKEVAQRVAHEIKNPLTPIQLNAERILKTLEKGEAGGTGGGEVIAQGARTIVQEAQTIKSLVDEFSAFARLPKTSLQPADLHAIVAQVVAMFRGIFGEVEFEVELSPEVPSPLPLDPEQMKRVLINLIDNAIDAMSKKGRISLRTGLDKDRSLVRIEVADTGPGIKTEDKDKLFLPHYSTKKKGTGLGLAIVHQIVKEHGGRIEVRNARPSGAVFSLWIPT